VSKGPGCIERAILLCIEQATPDFSLKRDWRGPLRLPARLLAEWSYPPWCHAQQCCPERCQPERCYPARCFPERRPVNGQRPPLTMAMRKAIVRAMHSFVRKYPQYALAGGKGRSELYLYDPSMSDEKAVKKERARVRRMLRETATWCEVSAVGHASSPLSREISVERSAGPPTVAPC
jgi:hypothetical protein